MANLLDRIKESLNKQGYVPRSKAARLWLQSKVAELNPSKNALMNDRNRVKNNSFIGQMYFYYYDPKTKDKLAYYDKFPLVIPIEIYPDGFLGLNLHYISPRDRILLLDKLSEIKTNNRYDSTTKLKISYSFLSSFSKAYEASPCIKRYLSSNIKSRFLEISADEWDIAALLPVESFVGASKQKVWSESRKKY